MPPFRFPFLNLFHTLKEDVMADKEKVLQFLNDRIIRLESGEIGNEEFVREYSNGVARCDDPSIKHALIEDIANQSMINQAKFIKACETALRNDDSSEVYLNLKIAVSEDKGRWHDLAETCIARINLIS